MINRRKSREMALQALYACDLAEHERPDDLIDYLAAESSCDAQCSRYSRDLLARTLAARDDIDRQIVRFAANWELKRMNAVDRNILRLAAAELLFFKNVPFKVVIDEAVELAKQYGTEESGKFVNGIIDSIRKSWDAGPPAAAQQESAGPKTPADGD